MSNRLDNLRPASDQHAIESVVFSMEWTTPLSNEDLILIKKHQDKFSHEFPRDVPHQSHTVVIEPGQAVQHTKDALNGIHFILPGSPPHLENLGIPMIGGQQGFLRALQINKENLVVIINDYTRWETEWGKVTKWLRDVLQLLASASVSSFSLQYTDTFRWLDNPDNFPLEQIVRKESKYLPANAFESRPLWHSHHGYAEEIQQDDIPCFAINNVNVTVGEVNSTKLLSILTSHRASFKSPLWGVDRFTALEVYGQRFHLLNNEILKQVLTQDVCTKINLV